MDPAQRLADELREKVAELEQALADLRQVRERVASQQKLAELGELSWGVAHSMRDPLQFIRNFASSSREIAEDLGEVLEQLDPAAREEAKELLQELTENMDRVVHHGDRANGIVSAMLTLDPGTGGGFRSVDLNQLVAEQTSLARQAVQVYEPSLRVEVTMETDPGLVEVVAVPEDVARAIANLVTNACQGMAEKVRLEGHEYRPELKVGTANTEDGAVISVRDNGTGMTAEAMARMFDPLFTTRDMGRNTGLGLSFAYDVAREHGGSMVGESDPGRHTEMRMFLPKHPGTQESARRSEDA
ncbi:MAG: ATP-binding protein [Dehalococcoidia bacterium]|nr:ATP-binding protein [Dehalococcoidia bacterium]